MSVLHAQLRKIVAEWLRSAMGEQWSQKALAEASGVTRETINRLLGEKTDVEPETVEKLAEALGSRPPAIIAGTDRIPGPGDEAVTAASDLAESVSVELSPMVARDVGRAIANAIRQAQLDRSRVGIDLPVGILLEFAARLNENHDDAAGIIRAAERLRSLKL
jgi:transcriptional regulator with XRE-family HTH domain